MFSLVLGTGVRLGSLVGLNVGDVDFVSGTIRVNGKGNVEHLLYLTPHLRRLIKRFLAGRAGASEPLFLSTLGRRLGPRQVQLRFARWLAHAEVERKASVHSLRHRFATSLYEKTGDLRLVQVALGHRNISTTEIYTRVPQRQIEQALRVLGDRLVGRQC
jgi:integrase/recombinase XerC